MASAWHSVLGRSPDEGDFFAAGGTSLAAARIAAALRTATGIPVTVRMVLSHPRPDALSAACTAAVGHSDGDRAGTIDSVSTPIVAPVSVQQEAIWFLEQMDPDDRSYQSTVIMRLDWPVDVKRLEVAAKATCLRHPILRTSWRFSDGRITQRVCEHVDLSIDELDVTGGRPEELKELIGQLGRRAFDLSAPPAIRWSLIKEAPRRYMLVQVEHHFVHDGWSMWRVMRDLANFYDTAGGRIADDPDSSQSYLGYCLDQRRWLGSASCEADVEWWRTRLQGGAPLRWPGDGRRPPAFTSEGATVETSIDRRRARRLTELAAQQGVTPFTVLMSVFVTTTARRTGQDCFNLGTMIRNRPPGYEDVVGMFVNTVALPIRVPIGLSVEELIGAVSQRLLEAEEHGRVPFPLVVARLGGPRDLGRNPVFQTCFSMNDFPDQKLVFGDGTTSTIAYPSNGGAKFDLDVVLAHEGDHFRVLWRYYVPLFQEEDVRHIAEEFDATLDVWTADHFHLDAEPCLSEPL